MFLFTRSFLRSFHFLATACATTLLPLSISSSFAEEAKQTAKKSHLEAHTSKTSPTAHGKMGKTVKTSSSKSHATHRLQHRKIQMCHTASQQRKHHKVKILQCVGYVHMAAPNFNIHGDAHTWWKKADENNYARGHIPEPGAVLSFKATKKMIYGHVAIVRSRENDRTIRIDHAHWGINGIDHNVRAVDVSPKNDWTSVRIAVRGNSGALGNVYPTNGFIYPWPKDNLAEREKHLKDKPFGNHPTAHVKFRLPIS